MMVLISREVDPVAALLVLFAIDVRAFLLFGLRRRNRRGGGGVGRRRGLKAPEGGGLGTDADARRWWRD